MISLTGHEREKRARRDEERSKDRETMGDLEGETYRRGNEQEGRTLEQR